MGLTAALRFSFAIWALAVLSLIGAEPVAHPAAATEAYTRLLGSEPVLRAPLGQAGLHLVAELGSIDEDDEEPWLLAAAPNRVGLEFLSADIGGTERTARPRDRRILPQATGPPA